VKRNLPAVYRFFRNKAPQEMDDLVQRTFLAAVNARARNPDILVFRAYLLGIARKELLMHLRRREVGERYFAPAEDSIDQLGDAFASCDELAQTAEQLLLLRALRRLQLDFQIALELFYWEQLSLAEMAVALEVAVGTVKSRLARAKAALRAELDRMDATDEVRHSTLVGFETWLGQLREHVAR
jgi:RNA polymerase sigma factor (sigma-70 family)